MQKRNTVLVAVLRPPVTSQQLAARIKAYVGDICNPIGVIPAALLPSSSEKDEKWREDGSQQTAPILMKNTHLYRTLQ